LRRWLLNFKRARNNASPHSGEFAYARAREVQSQDEVSIRFAGGRGARRVQALRCLSAKKKICTAANSWESSASTFLIDAQGVLQREGRKVKVKGHAAEVLAAAQQL